MNLLQNNVVGQVLAGLIGVLMLLAVALGVAWSRAPGPILSDNQAMRGAETPSALTMRELAELEQYAEITARPAFNPSRRPEQSESDEVEVVAENGGQGRELPPLRLTGVVITPEFRVATLVNEGNQQSFFAHEGEPLSNDPDTQLDRWFLTEVKARNVTLAQRGGGELALELQVHDRPIDAPPAAQRNVPVPTDAPEPVDEAAPTDMDDAEPGDGEELPETRAEEIRRRIEERREELRRQQEEESGGAAAPPSAQNYREAIRNMINAKPSAADDNETNEDNDE